MDLAKVERLGPERCPICDWPMADSQEKGCIPGDCCYRPDDPAEQRRIRERRAALTNENAYDIRPMEERLPD